MRIVRGVQNLSYSIPHAVVTIGNFDGVHLGHQQMIRTAIQEAKNRQGQSVAFTFRPHPQVVLWPEKRLQLLSGYDEKLEILLQLGLDWVIEEPFSRQFSEIEPEQFFTDILIRGLNAEMIVVGYDFAFGRGRQGHLESLGNFCRKVDVELMIVPPQKLDGKVVSSSLIRQHLLAGEIEKANSFLGRPFSYRGTVVQGDGRGKKIGFPTANLKILTSENKIPLPYGVYVTQTSWGSKIYPSVTNFGVRPTFHSADSSLILRDQNEPQKGLQEELQEEQIEFPALVENHLLDMSPDLYGATIEVNFLHRLRDEKKFDGVEALKCQLEKDILEAKKFFK